VGLTGVIQKRIDSKGRLSIPKKLRALLLDDPDTGFTLLKLDGCLQLYPNRTWAELQEKMGLLSPFAERTRKLQRFWGMQSDLIELDSEGRVTLSKDQKQYAGIEDDVMVVGAINKVEIWSVGSWRSMMLDAPKLEEIANEIAESN